jgi:hypothetical protein
MDDEKNQVWTLPSPLPVSEAILRYRPRYRNRVHLTGLYSRAFEGFERQAVRVLGMGGDSLVIELTDGNVLSITNKILGPNFGRRPFDLPSLEVGVRNAGSEPIHYFIRPRARSPVNFQELRAFLDSLPEHIVMTDRKRSNVGEYEGRLWLIDAFAVTDYTPRPRLGPPPAEGPCAEG